MSTLYEFSRPLSLDTVAGEGRSFAIEADAAERDALARRLDLVRIDALSAQGHVRPGPRAGIVIVHGTVKAALAQSCVVTLEPVPVDLAAPFERYFSLDGDAQQEDEVLIGVDDEEPEPLAGDVLDIGEIVTEELSLALDPYPRSPGADAVLDELGIVREGQERKASPFDVLDSLRRGRDQD